MVEVEVGEEYVTFKLEGVQKFLALKSRVRIPLKNIDSISTQTVKPLWLAVTIGSRMPPIFWAGTFWTREGKTFYYVMNRSKCITLSLRNHEYSKVVMEVDDKQSIANNLRQLIKQ